ncbi:class I adenylate-forming enzyme family protein [Lacimicrobium alkaliphilum]|uniref:AMP-dependent acyl-CoA synthetase n=1 Tax=Lacimicrobium alkaliphilum TaxID=1526571 RepID=A0ABQ1R6Z7_9ALTE|nr:AMP-binding protein [Lacimicrobium alkaliphilum]GGD60641.1 AMP-dependent acyl-CoA synthetase [Lacimicrobium alkaliphilum]
MLADSPRLPLPIDYLYKGLAIDADAPAATDRWQTVSYRELVYRVEALATALTQRYSKGTRIALCAENHIDHLTAYLAILASGAVWIPINPKNGAQLNQQLLQQSCPALVISDNVSRATLPKDTAIPIMSVSDADNTDDCVRTLIEKHYKMPFTAVRPDPQDIMAIKFTGGTTGTPKGVMQTHHNVSAVVASLQQLYDFNQQDCNLAVAPLTHGGSHYILPVLATGGRHILLDKPDVSSILAAFEASVSICFMPPTLIYKLLDTPGVSKASFPYLRHLTYGAAPMPVSRIRQVRAVIGERLSTLYGQTEAPMTITALSCEDMSDPDLQLSVGKPCRFSQVAIISADNTLLGPMAEGEIAVRGDIVMAGYYQQPEATFQAFCKDWLLTGDLGYVDENGYLFIKGRSKEVIISGGFNVYPAEVEAALCAQDSIVEAAVFGLPDPYWGEQIAAAVVLSKPEITNESELKALLKELLGPVKTPKAIYFIDKLPRNPVGKVVRREVQQLISQKYEQPHA